MRKARRTPRPFDGPRLEEAALRYVGRFATTRAKLRLYLTRKLRERGWEGVGDPAIDLLVERFAASGYIDDRAFALAKATAHAARGLGKRRLAIALRAAGVDDDDGRPAFAAADEEAVESAVRFARRRRLGPFAQGAETDLRTREKALAAMVRAGHGFDLAKAILAFPPGTESALDELRERFARSSN